MTKRILVLCEYPSLNGGERSLLAMLDQLQCDEIQLCFAAPAEGPLAEAIRQRGYPHDPLSLHDATGRRHAIETCRSQLADVIISCKPDLVHANSLAMSRLAGPVATGLDIPCLGHLRDMMKVNRTVRRDLAMNSRLVAVSHATREWYLAMGMEPERVQVLYNGVDLDQFRPRLPTGCLHRELALPPDGAIVGTIGQIGMRKGVDLVMRAAKRITAKRPDVHFALVGQRFSKKQEALDYETELHRFADVAGISDRVHWLGSRGDVPQLMNEFSVLLHLARQEPLGRVLLEAAASGLPCVASDVGGTREIFPHECQAATLVASEASDLAADAVLQLLGDEAHRKTLGDNARLRAKRQFDSRIAADRLADHYRSLLGS